MAISIPAPVGIALMIGAVLWSLWKADEARRLRVRFRVRPWLYRPDWREGIVYDKSPKTAWWDTIAAGGLFVLGLGTFLWDDDYRREGWVPIAMILVFAGIPFGIRLYIAMNKNASYAASFRFDQVPMRVGGPFRGTVHVRLPPLAFFTFVEISLAGRQYDGQKLVAFSGEIAKTLHDSEVGQRGTEARIPIELEISASKPPSQPFQAQPFNWELRISIPELKWEAHFGVPVFSCDPDQVDETRYARRLRMRAERKGERAGIISPGT